jgi:NADH-quinone oxidoreductase subunit J
LLTSLVFEFLYFLATASALLVVLARNPVHAVLNLVLVFMFSSWLLLWAEVYLIGILLLQLYAGAVAVLFLFCVMMLTPFSVVDSGFEKKFFLNEFFFIFSGFNFVQFLYWCYFFFFNFFFVDFSAGFAEANFLFAFNLTIVDFGFLLYTYYSLIFILLGYVLLTSMLGSIILTLSHRLNIKRQVISYQVRRDLSLSFA